VGASCKIGATKRTSEDADEDSLNECNLSTHNLIDDMEYSIHLLAQSGVELAIGTNNSGKCSIELHQGTSWL
jgi:hypothetical protein